jgi:hypothetical protein
MLTKAILLTLLACTSSIFALPTLISLDLDVGDPIGDIIGACEGKHHKQSCTVGGETGQCLDATVSVTSPDIPFLRRAN